MIKGLQVCAQKSKGKLKIKIEPTAEAIKVKEIKAKKDPTNADIMELLGLIYEAVQK